MQIFFFYYFVVIKHGRRRIVQIVTYFGIYMHISTNHSLLHSMSMTEIDIHCRLYSWAISLL